MMNIVIFVLRLNKKDEDEDEDDEKENAESFRENVLRLWGVGDACVFGV